MIWVQGAGGDEETQFSRYERTNKGFSLTYAYSLRAAIVFYNHLRTFDEQPAFPGSSDAAKGEMEIRKTEVAAAIYF